MSKSTRRFFSNCMNAFWKSLKSWVMFSAVFVDLYPLGTFTAYFAESILAKKGGSSVSLSPLYPRSLSTWLWDASLPSIFGYYWKSTDSFKLSRNIIKASINTHKFSAYNLVSELQSPAVSYLSQTTAKYTIYIGMIFLE